MLLVGCGGGSTSAGAEAAGGGTGGTGGTASVKTTAAVSTAVDVARASTPAAADADTLQDGVGAMSETLAVSKCREPVAITTGTSPWGTFDKPFAANSPWNSRPINPVLGTTTIPTSSYFPAVAGGEYGTAAFKAAATDGPMTITGTDSRGVWDPDSEVFKPSIVIPRWPGNVIAATGSDGHAEVVDAATGIVHSFWQLRQVNGAWQAAQYAWSPLAGRGMGDPAHYWQGARSAGVSTLGGLMRIAEVKDGDTMYRHALTMSLTYNGLSNSPTYQFPVTGSDWDAAWTNSGQLPIGSLMMLPANFDAQSLATPELRKVAETLKAYGAYVVDRNWGTPFVIYVENGADFALHKNGWDNATASDLDRMRAAMRPLVSANNWLDGNGRAYKPVTALNLLSMRGSYWVMNGNKPGVYDTWRQAVVFPPSTTVTEQGNDGGRAYSGVNWGAPAVGAKYRLTAFASGGASFRLTIKDTNTGAQVYDSYYMTNNQTTTISWPTKDFRVTTYVKSGTGNVESAVRAELVPSTTTAGSTWSYEPAAAAGVSASSVCGS